MALIPPFFLDAVAAIGFPEPGGTRYAATGFLYGRPEHEAGDTPLCDVLLFTNRHVFNGQPAAVLRFNPIANLPAREYDLPLLGPNGELLWVSHPNPKIDVAAARINLQKLQEDAIRLGYFQSDKHAAPRQRATKLGMSEGDGVFVLGFPMGLVGVQRNFIVVRQGAVARLQDCLAGHESTFLIDCSIFPGNSGGPVISKPEVVGIEGTTTVNAAYLMGIVNAYVPYRDVAVSLQTGKPRVTFEENSGLASVFPVDYIDEVFDLLVPQK
jgi:S1-C subfamily serine protease